MLMEESIAWGLKTSPEVDPTLPMTDGMAHDKRAAERPISNASVFKRTDTYLEVCGQFEAQRGMLGFAVCLIPTAMIGFLSYQYVLVIADTFQGLVNADESLNLAGRIVLLTGMSLILFGLIWFFKKLVLPLVRIDYFTTRRTLIRFNRVTRKVYVHNRPSAGGIVVHDWDDARATLDNPAAFSPEPVSEKDANLGHGRLILCWVDMEAAQMRGLIFVGRAAGTAARGRAWWEYIRRYMEEGAESVPQPFLRPWKGAWPHMSLLEVFYLYPERLLRGGPLWWVLLPCLAPLDLMRATLHWLAMLLCVEPKFPPEIESAGLIDGAGLTISSSSTSQSGVKSC